MNKQIVKLLADGRFSLGVPAAPLKPFVLGGIGMAYQKATDFSGSNAGLAASLNALMPESATNFYFNVGAGADFKTGPAWSLFAQVRYVSIATEGEASAWVPITLGLKFF